MGSTSVNDTNGVPLSAANTNDNSAFNVPDKKLLDKITTLEVQIKELEKSVDEQEESAKLLVKRDMELVRSNEKLLKFDETKSKFVSIVAHQLRTPLSGVKWALKMLMDGDVGKITDEQIEFTGKAYDSNERMIRLVNDMLCIDKLESGEFRYSFRKINLFDILDTVLYDLYKTVEKKKIAISIVGVPRESFPLVLADDEKIHLVFQNLLENAVNYTPQGGSVKIDFQVNGEESVTISVSDTGIGIPVSEQGSIYSRFFRASNATKVVVDGSGLGLYIMREVIMKHGGKVGFESAEGKGTTFHFTLSIH